MHGASKRNGNAVGSLSRLAIALARNYRPDLKISAISESATAATLRATCRRTCTPLPRRWKRRAEGERAAGRVREGDGGDGGYPDSR